MQSAGEPGKRYGDNDESVFGVLSGSDQQHVCAGEQDCKGKEACNETPGSARSFFHDCSLKHRRLALHEHKDERENCFVRKNDHKINSEETRTAIQAASSRYRKLCWSSRTAPR